MKIAQFSDCHLFADKLGRHHGVNVYQHLVAVLRHIQQHQAIDFAIFTGDLTQDHSEHSYQRFVDAVNESQFSSAIYFTAGNHDELALLNKYLVGQPFLQEKQINSDTWQVYLVNSKGETPAGFIEQEQLLTIEASANSGLATLLVMHHHAIDVGFGIDKHGIDNKKALWQSIHKNSNIKGILCGHVHNAFELSNCQLNHQVTLYTCPATSIEFDTQSADIQATETGPGYQIIELLADGNIKRQVTYLARPNG